MSLVRVLEFLHDALSVIKPERSRGDARQDLNHDSTALDPHTLRAEASIDPVGTVGGLRIYIPASMANHGQFPFRPGDMTTITALPNGLLVTKKMD
jgi:hypothetical protein